MVKISATRARLEEEANRVNFNMRLHAKTLRNHDVALNKRTRELQGSHKPIPHTSFAIRNLDLTTKCQCLDPSADDFYPYHVRQPVVRCTCISVLTPLSLVPMVMPVHPLPVRHLAR